MWVELHEMETKTFRPLELVPKKDSTLVNLDMVLTIEKLGVGGSRLSFMCSDRSIDVAETSSEIVAKTRDAKVAIQED